MKKFRISSSPRSGYNFLVNNLDQAIPMIFGTAEHQHAPLDSDYDGIYIVPLRAPLETIRSAFVMNLHLDRYLDTDLPSDQVNIDLRHYITFCESVSKAKNAIIIDFNDLSKNSLNTVNYVLKTLGSNVVQQDVKEEDYNRNKIHLKSSDIYDDYLMYDELILNAPSYQKAVKLYSQLIKHKAPIDQIKSIQYTKHMREPKIMKMDWRSLGYWPVYKDGKLTWEKDTDENVN